MSALVRCVDFDRRLKRGLATRAEPFEHGVALFRDELPLSYDLNALAVDPDASVGAGELAAAADRIQGGAGLLHRKVTLDAAPGARLAGGLRALGWEATELVVMAHDGRELPAGDAEELAPEQLEPLWADGIAREPWGDEEAVRQLVAAQHARREAIAVRYFGVRAGGRAVSSCELFSDGRTGQIESVWTLPKLRGRGYATAAVGAAAAASRGLGHDLTFLLAEAEDWPRRWYRTLGFEEIGSIWDAVRTVQPLRDLRLRTPRLELRLGTREELLALAAVARAGVHPAERMPFYVPWTDRSREPGFAREFVEHHRRSLAEWSPEDWTLNLVAFSDGQPAGMQSLRAESFAQTGVVDSGSWLGESFQNRGLGTEMRSAVLELAFRGLGAVAATSGSFEDNPQSARVSAKLGYEQVGERVAAPRGEPVRERVYRLERDRWRSPVPVKLERVEPALPYFGPFSAKHA